MTFSTYHFFSYLVEQKKGFRTKGSMTPFLKKTVNNLPVTVGNRDNSGFWLLPSGELLRSKAFKEKKYEVGVPSGTAYWKSKVEGKSVSSVTKHPCYYLLEGHFKQNKKKLCLINGAFFDSLSPAEVFLSSFDIKIKLSIQEKKFLNDILINGNLKSKKSINNSPLHAKFFVESKINPNSNPLDSTKYPQIKDNTLNFLVPCHSTKEENLHLKRMKQAFSERNVGSLWKKLDIFALKHLLNGPFLVFQTSIK